METSFPEDTGLLKYLHKTRSAVQFYHALIKTPPPSPKKRLDGSFKTSTEPGVQPRLPLRSGPTQRASVGKARSSRLRRSPAASPAPGSGAGGAGAGTKAGAAARPLPGRPPGGRQLGPPRPARVVSGVCRAPRAASPTTHPERIAPHTPNLHGPSREPPPPPPPRRKQSPRAHRRQQPLAVLCPRTPAPPPFKIQVRDGGRGRLLPPRPVTHSAAAPGVPLAAAAPRLPPSARAPGSGLIAKLPPPPPVRAGESVKLPSSMQLPQPSRCLSPSPGRPGPAPGRS